jgi:hypothetical protein
LDSSGLIPEVSKCAAAKPKSIPRYSVEQVDIAASAFHRAAWTRAVARCEDGVLKSTRAFGRGAKSISDVEPHKP